MKREDFKKIIKLRSCWKIDRRIGNYTLPDGSRLTGYIEKLVKSQMNIDNLAIRENGNLCFVNKGNKVLMPAFEENEEYDFDEQEKRIDKLVSEIIG